MPSSRRYVKAIEACSPQFPTATHTKAVFGVPPTNKKIEAIFWDLHRFNDEGLIVETWNMMDNLAIMQQLGLTPA